MARPFKCANISELAVGRELYIDTEEELSIDDEYDNFPCHH
jgi:hypothetical protein